MHQWIKTIKYIYRQLQFVNRHRTFRHKHSYYNTDRTQYVIYDGIQSTTLPISCGVPQGSILGPLLFIFTMNDIGNVSEFLYTILYADDTCVLLNGKVCMNLVTFLNCDLDK